MRFSLTGTALFCAVIVVVAVLLARSSQRDDGDAAPGLPVTERSHEPRAAERAVAHDRAVASPAADSMASTRLEVDSSPAPAAGPLDSLARRTIVVVARATGRPVAEATVSAVRPFGRLKEIGVTDADGSLAWPIPPLGRSVLVATADGQLGTLEVEDSRSGPHRVAIGAVDMGSGHLVDTEGAQVTQPRASVGPGAPLQVELRVPLQGPAPVPTAGPLLGAVSGPLSGDSAQRARVAVDASGRFRLEQPWPADTTITARGWGYHEVYPISLDPLEPEASDADGQRRVIVAPIQRVALRLIDPADPQGTAVGPSYSADSRAVRVRGGKGRYLAVQPDQLSTLLPTAGEWHDQQRAAALHPLIAVFDSARPSTARVTGALHGYESFDVEVPFRPWLDERSWIAEVPLTPVADGFTTIEVPLDLGPDSLRAPWSIRLTAKEEGARAIRYNLADQAGSRRFELARVPAGEYSFTLEFGRNWSVATDTVQVSGAPFAVLPIDLPDRPTLRVEPVHADGTSYSGPLRIRLGRVPIGVRSNWPGLEYSPASTVRWDGPPYELPWVPTDAEGVRILEQGSSRTVAVKTFDPDATADWLFEVTVPDETGGEQR